MAEQQCTSPGPLTAAAPPSQLVRAGQPGEQLLLGGTSNSGRVTRVGDTVRRPQSARSGAVHALLEHLAEVGFDGAPRYLGQDALGREVLSYVPGDAAAPDRPWALTDAALVSVAELLRRFHEAAASFDGSAHAWPTSVPPQFRSGLVCHNDVNLDNVVFRDGRAVALIDFDLASPGSAVWEVALTARLWSPLRPEADIGDARRGRSAQRLALFVDAYGLPAADRQRVVDAAIATHGWCYSIVRDGAARGVPGYLAYWTADTAQRVDRTQAWLVQSAASLQGALGPGPA